MNDNGILLVDKPEGITSHDVVNLMRRRFGFKKVGHAGTLDPIATGLLVMLVGKATKLSDTFLNDDKEYYTIVKLGESTDTADAHGKVTRTSAVKPTADEVAAALSKFKGKIEQKPPMFSAKKHKGKKLYELARKGVEVPRKAANVEIFELDMISYEYPFLALKVRCSKGTYIRQLAQDVGDALGAGGHVVTLRRLASGSFKVEDAVTVDTIKKMGLEDVYGCLIEKE